MTRVDIVAGKLRVEMLGWDKLWAFKSRLEVACDSVVSSRRWEKGEMSRFRGIRAPGTSLPGVFIAGTYHQRAGGAWHHNFFAVHNFDRAVVIALQQEWYSELVIEVEDPDDTLRLIAGRASA